MYCEDAIPKVMTLEWNDSKIVPLNVSSFLFFLNYSNLVLLEIDSDLIIDLFNPFNKVMR